MSAQTMMIADTIAGMKQCLSKYHDSSDSEDPYLRSSNRGNKLKRKAQYHSGGTTGRPGGAKAYKTTVVHAGFQRDILRRNPKRYDGDGDELEDDDADDEADARAAEENPYTEVRLESLLSPLVSAARLPEHSSLSVPYLSPTLSDMTQNACEMVHKERQSLYRAKRILTHLRGDHSWIPCGMLETEHDDAIFDTEKVYKNIVCAPSTEDLDIGNRRLHVANESLYDGSLVQTRDESKTMSGYDLTAAPKRSEPDGPPEPLDANQARGIAHASRASSSPTLPPALKPKAEDVTGTINTELTNILNGKSEEDVVKKGADGADTSLEDEIVEIIGAEVSISNNFTGNSHDDNEDVVWKELHDTNHPRTASQDNISQVGSPCSEGGRNLSAEPRSEENQRQNMDGQNKSPVAPRRMRTRAQAQVLTGPTITSSRSQSPDSYLSPSIHQLFLIPESAKTDPDIGLPPQDAEETRRMLTLYVQKQEEVCRGAEKLYEGLLLANRQRQEVLKWCKAEGHIGEMSDGEDWYDKDEWGLEDDLRKGQAEEEEDAGVQGKKTRGRRAG